MSAATVSNSLAKFIDRALKVTTTDYFEAGHDPDWRSPCEIEVIGAEGKCRWKPVKQARPVDFAGLANALEAPIHEDIAAYYGSYWSGNFEARSFEGPVSLIQLWNDEDFERLIGNLIGHAIAKQRARQPFTVFFATTDPDSELFLSIDNESGKVLLEEPGRPPIKEVEQSVAAFLDRLTPLDVTPAIY
ncbi:MAG: SecY-interacting protein Syd [Pseudomonadales bacterium]